MATTSTTTTTTTAAAPRRSKTIGRRRRLEDEADDDVSEAILLDDDSASEGSIVTDETAAAHESDSSEVDEPLSTSPNATKPSIVNGTSHGLQSVRQLASLSREARGNTDITSAADSLNGLSLSNHKDLSANTQASPTDTADAQAPQAPATMAPMAAGTATESFHERQRREHEEYRRRREQDPSFVPNRGAFFMHDHRHAASLPNGFRPYGRGRGGRDRGPMAGPFHVSSQHHRPFNSLLTSQWTHDLHEESTAAISLPPRLTRPPPEQPREGPVNGNGVVPICSSSPTPINRDLSAVKHIGNVQVRVSGLFMKAPAVMPGLAVKLYAKMPEHRPPLRRDKPVRISLPGNAPRYVFPAIDRSFIFIPRAMRPNQQQHQRGRGRGQVRVGSTSGFSQRTSIFGGSYYGSAYAPSVAVSRRSSVAHHELARDFMGLPAPVAATAHQPMPRENGRPIVRLPPPPPPRTQPPVVAPPAHPAVAAVSGAAVPSADKPATMPPPPPPPASQSAPLRQELPSLPAKPTPLETRPASAPSQKPIPPPKALAENPDVTLGSQRPDPAESYQQQAFHHQVPMQMANGYSHESHNRNASSYATPHSTGTPLSQILERAIHAAPFHPATGGAAPPTFTSQPFYNPAYPPPPLMMAAPLPHGYYYPQPFPSTMTPAGAAAPFVPPGLPGPITAAPSDRRATPSTIPQVIPGSNLVAQEMNGTVYYYNPAQLPPVALYPSYPATASYSGMVPMIGPPPDGYYYPPQDHSIVYYNQ